MLHLGEIVLPRNLPCNLLQLQKQCLHYKSINTVSYFANMRPFSAAMWKHVQIKHGNICFGEHKPSAICPLTADCAEWDEFPPNIIHNLCNLTSTIPRLKISQHGHKKDEINDGGRIDELMDVKGKRRGHKMKKIWMRQRWTSARQPLNLSLTHIYSGYGKYSDPLKFFTLCYIAAIW